jgi:hypothetical protein
MRNDDKNGGLNPLDPDEGHDNHPGASEREQAMTKRPRAGSGPARDAAAGAIGEKSRGKSHHASDKSAGHGRNYGGYDSEAAGGVGDRRNLGDLDPKERGPRDEEEEG